MVIEKGKGAMRPRCSYTYVSENRCSGGKCLAKQMVCWPSLQEEQGCLKSAVQDLGDIPSGFICSPLFSISAEGVLAVEGVPQMFTRLIPAMAGLTFKVDYAYILSSFNGSS